jgi:hypothetical protein
MELALPTLPNPPSPRARVLGPSMVFAATAPFAVGALIAARTGTYAPVAAVPGVVFGVIAATSPALYIASAATGTAPPLAAIARAFMVALGAFGIALAGLLLPATFLALSAVAPTTAFVMASAAIGGAGVLALWRLATELRAAWKQPSVAASGVFLVWWVATLGIAGRLWWDLATEVLS